MVACGEGGMAWGIWRTIGSWVEKYSETVLWLEIVAQPCL